ncbi:MAG: hypothetical protein M1358_18915 [Chloroflexi bacterium]|nr:hypothetical protein [Chloroflexota bacterium]
MRANSARHSNHYEDGGDEVNLGVVFLVAISLLLLLSFVIFFGGIWVLPPTAPAPLL